jgi:hypothetical protein
VPLTSESTFVPRQSGIDSKSQGQCRTSSVVTNNRKLTDISMGQHEL